MLAPRPRLFLLLSLAFFTLWAPATSTREGPPRLPVPHPAVTPAVLDVKARPLTSFVAGEQEPVRIAAHPTAPWLYVLGGGGDVWLLDPATGKRALALKGADYIAQP